MSETFILVFPGGMDDMISVVDITNTEWEIDHYSLASVKQFPSAEAAKKYGRELARKHGRKFDEPPRPLDAED